MWQLIQAHRLSFRRISDLSWGQICRFNLFSVFGSDNLADHYYARIEGHELLTDRDLILLDSALERAADWYYELHVGPLQHKLPPIVAHSWRRITFGWTRSAKRDTNFSGPHKWVADR